MHVDLESRAVTAMGAGEEDGYVFAHGDRAYVVGLDGSRVHATFEPSVHEPLPFVPMPPG